MHEATTKILEQKKNDVYGVCPFCSLKNRIHVFLRCIVDRGLSSTCGHFVRLSKNAQGQYFIRWSSKTVPVK